MKFGIVVVIYNNYCHECKTLKSLDFDAFDSILVLDNSDEKYIASNADYCNKQHLQYNSFGKNIGLSKAYNYALDFFKDQDFDFIITADDDTNFTSDYLSQLQTFNFNTHTIYAPLIYQGDVLINPYYHTNNEFINIFKKRNYQTLKQLQTLINDSHLYAINSGLIIPFSFFKTYRYNENIFLDCVDYEFCQAVYDNGYHIDIYPYQVEQTYSVDQIPRLVEGQQRFEIRLQDTKAYAPGCFFANKCFLALLYAIRSHDVKYLKYIFKG